MELVVPQIACVRPRGRLRPGDPPWLVEDLLEEYREEHPTGVLWIDGPSGAGKSTALAHLATRFRGDPRFLFVDNVNDNQVPHESDRLLVVASNQGAVSHRVRCLRMEPWSFDEFVEYLLARHPEACSSVMERLGNAARKTWAPIVAEVILEGFATKPSLHDPEQAILSYLTNKLKSADQYTCAQRVALMYQSHKFEHVFSVMVEALKRLPPDVRALLSHEVVHLPLAASYLVDEISARTSYYQDLESSLSPTLIRAVARQLAELPAAVRRLKRKLRYFSTRSEQSALASILFAVDPTWKPAPGPLARVYLSGGYFPEADWQNIKLEGNCLSDCELGAANLARLVLTDTNMCRANLSRGNLQSASLEHLRAVHTDFGTANLTDANLRNANLNNCCFAGAQMNRCNLSGAQLHYADLTDASLQGADLTRARLLYACLTDADLCEANLSEIYGRGVDFRTVDLRGARAPSAILCRANLEDVVWHDADLRDADLSYAHLTGSRLPWAKLQGAKLRRTGLAEIDWENADLRDADLSDATFHMGSSRSGLVGSPYASEGTRTGFYTDDLEEIYFKRPEEVRKANLRGADLRGADTTDVDFYLVDLRDAKLDPAQLRQARQTGAILSEKP